MKFSNQVDEIRARAYELARSGRYSDCPSVRGALEREGYANAVRFALDDPIVKAHVAGLCAESCEQGQRTGRGA